MEQRETIQQILVRRDGMTEDEAQARFDEVARTILETMAEGDCSLEDIEQIIEDEFGLEPDYFDEFI